MDTNSSKGEPQLKYSTTEPNAGTSDPTDGRKQYDCLTRYPSNIRKEILAEGIILFIMLLFSLFVLFATWKGWFCYWFSLSGEEVNLFKKYAFYASSGMLGGITFGMKYFYRVVARGYWHQDRRFWRMMSPLIATVISLIVGTMIDASVMKVQKPISGAAIVSIGFLAGYFADEAVGKMAEIAMVIFGKSAIKKSDDGKSDS